MKRVFILIMLVLAPFSIYSQKFGHVNTSNIIPLMTEYTKAQSDIQTLQKQYEDEIKYLEEELNGKVKDYEAQSATLPDNIKQRREQEIMEKQQRLQQFVQDCQVNLQNRSNELMEGIYSKLNKTLEAVGLEGNYICIFDVAGGAVPFVNSTLTTDVTQLVKDKLGIK